MEIPFSRIHLRSMASTQPTTITTARSNVSFFFILFSSQVFVLSVHNSLLVAILAYFGSNVNIFNSRLVNILNVNFNFLRQYYQ